MLRRALWVMPVLVWGACRPGPVRTANTAPLPKPEEALATLRAQSQSRKSLRAMGKVTYFGKEGRVRVKAALLAERPGSFRVETISPFEQPLDVMTCDGERLWLLSGGRLREGPATPENIARLLPLLMRPEEVVGTLLGGVPLGATFKPTALAWAEDQKRWVLTMEGLSKEIGELTIDPARKIVEQMRILEPDGSVRLQVGFEDFETVSGAEFPRKIHIEMPKAKMDVKIKMVEFELNVALQEKFFRLQAEGVTPEPLGMTVQPAPQSTPSK